MEEAKSFLTQSSLPINTVSLYVGYSNFSYFTKMFKIIRDTHPLEYKKRGNFGDDNKTAVNQVRIVKEKGQEPGDIFRIDVVKFQLEE